ncbi:FAD binding domain-containing protein [Alkalicoccobacillus gibsonii]|uniref:FAD binding domain-containing protein n=1 Tax=Alkalicoccobacillus gibsonii TaxID=79881 RepID=UPI003F7C0BF9
MQMEEMIPRPPSVWLPQTVEEAWQYKETYGVDAEFVAGGTFIQVKREKLGILAPHLISLHQISALQGIEETIEGTITVGANVTLSQCLHHPLFIEGAPLVEKAISIIGAPAIRNQGTLGGNVVYGIGDTLPALLALEATVTTYNTSGYSTMLLEEYLHDVDSALLVAVHIPTIVEPKNQYWFYEKVGRREAFVPSIVTVAMCLTWDDTKTFQFARLIVSGSDHPPQRLQASQSVIEASAMGTLDLEQVKTCLHSDITFSRSAFSSSSYLEMVATNMFYHQFKELIQSS